MSCRCGWSGRGDHLCHRCGKVPGTPRFYVPSMRFSLAGAQMKVSAKDTTACDTCWEEFQKLSKLEHGEWYSLKGGHVLRLAGFPTKPGGSLQFKSVGGMSSWIALDDVIRPVTNEHLDNFEKNAKARNIDTSWVDVVREAIKNRK